MGTNKLTDMFNLNLFETNYQKVPNSIESTLKFNGGFFFQYKKKIDNSAEKNIVNHTQVKNKWYYLFLFFI